MNHANHIGWETMVKWRVPKAINENPSVIRNICKITQQVKATILRSSHQRCSVKKDALRNFEKFTEKNLRQSPILQNL